LKPSSNPFKADAASDFTEERRLIHELANHLTIVQGAVAKALRTLQENPAGMAAERERLQKAEDYVRKSIQALKDLRSEVQVKINRETGS